MTLFNTLLNPIHAVNVRPRSTSFPDLKPSTYNFQPVKAKAFTLVEVLVALAIMAIALTALLHLNLVNLKLTQHADRQTLTTLAAQNLMEQTLAAGVPEPGTESGTIIHANRELAWQTNVTSESIAIADTEIEIPLRRIAVTVTDNQDRNTIELIRYLNTH